MTVTHGAEDDLPEEKIVPQLSTNLARMGAVYKFRARVPTDLLEHYAPKREIVESLKTKDLAEARRRLPIVQKRHHDEWEHLRQAKFETELRAPVPKTQPVAIKKLPITQETIDYLCSLLAHDSLAGDEQPDLLAITPLKRLRSTVSALTSRLNGFVI